jgi:hypothetical protein
VLLGLIVIALSACIGAAQCTGKTIVVSIGLIDTCAEAALCTADYAALFLDGDSDESWTQDAGLYSQDNTLHTFRVKWASSPTDLGVSVYNTTTDGVQDYRFLHINPSSLPFHSTNTPCGSAGRDFTCAISMLCTDAATVVPAKSDLSEPLSNRITHFYFTNMSQRDLDLSLLVIVFGPASVLGAILFGVLLWCMKRRL